MTIKIWELGSNLSWKDGVGSTERITQSSLNFLLHLMNGSMFVKKLRQKSEHLWDLLHIQVNENTFTDTESFFFRIDRFLLHCFSQLAWIYHCYFLLIFFLLFYELKSIKNANYRIAKKIGNSFRFTNDLVAINDGNEFENLPMWTYFDTETFNETTKTETS